MTGGTQIAGVLVFYNKPTPPSGLFDPFLNIPSISNNVTTRSFLDFILSDPSDTEAGFRQVLPISQLILPPSYLECVACNLSSGAFMTVSLANVSSNVVQTVMPETQVIHTYMRILPSLFPTDMFWLRSSTQKWGAYNLNESGAFVEYSIEPFLTSIPQHATWSAFPHYEYASPLNIYFSWTSSTADSFQLEGIKQTAEKIAAVAKAEGQDIDSLTLYPNYCLADTPLERMYGSNVKALKAIKKEFDPLNVMGHAGG